MSVHSPATKEALEYGEALAFHAMEHGESEESTSVLLEGFAAITAENPKKTIKSYLKKVRAADLRTNGVKFNPTDKGTEGARDAVKFTKYVAALNKVAE